MLQFALAGRLLVNCFITHVRGQILLPGYSMTLKATAEIFPFLSCDNIGIRLTMVSENVSCPKLNEPWTQRPLFFLIIADELFHFWWEMESAGGERYPNAEGKFVYCVKTTKVCYRPSCSSRLALRKNVMFSIAWRRQWLPLAWWTAVEQTKDGCGRRPSDSGRVCSTERANAVTDNSFFTAGFVEMAFPSSVS